MTWLRVTLKIYLEQQLLITFYVINHFILLKIEKIMDIKEVLLNEKHFFDKKFTFAGDVKNENMSNQELRQKLHKSILRKFEKQKGQSLLQIQF